MHNKYIGNDVQLFDVRQYRFSDGKSQGTRAVDVWNGADLHLTILPDRCLDLFTVRYKNRNMAYHTPNGVVNPAYYNEHGIAFLRSFEAGFLKTCGLKNYGTTDGSDPDMTFHGRIGNTPCEDLCVVRSDDGEEVTVSGVMRECIIFGTNYTLKRTINVRHGVNKISIKDEITNHGYTKGHLSMLYHFNMGYPLLSENSKIVIPSLEAKPGTDHAKQYPDSWNKFTPPVEDFPEMLFEHKLSEKKVGIDSPDINTSMRIEFDSPVLDHFLQWKVCQSGIYVCGLEPMTGTNSGYKANVENGTQKYIEPGQTITNKFEISFCDLA